MASDYLLQSFLTKNIYPDTGWLLDPPGETQPSLLRAVYPDKQLIDKGIEHGIYRFSDWLPISRELKASSAPVTYKSEGLASFLGLSDLYITFSGYWPEKGATMETCSFKETEAYVVGGRLSALNTGTLVVASAGNTARSFAKVCSDNEIPLLLCMPEDCIDAMWFENPLNSCVKLIVTPSGSDYFDAIHLSNEVCKLPGYFAEGGAKNVARRDGMGTTVLSAVPFIGRIPDYYFQAVGSGTGAIAAWEANLRFIEDGRYGTNKMKLMVSQNTPFLPMHDAWKQDSRALLPLSDDLAREQVVEIDAKVLSNRRPPYGIAGGLYDAMIDAGGDFIAVSNEEARKAAAIFEETEGIDIHPAAAVAVASLIDYCNNNNIRNNTIMLNITGGGEKRFKQGKQLFYLKPSAVIPLDAGPNEIKIFLQL
jgi:cysteate synthase